MIFIKLLYIVNVFKHYFKEKSLNFYLNENLYMCNKLYIYKTMFLSKFKSSLKFHIFLYVEYNVIFM